MWRFVLDSHLSPATEGKLRGLCSQHLLSRVKLERILDGHEGCVNTVSFTPDGSQLISGSDDLQIVMWNWAAGRQTLKFSSGHHNNVFQARALPHTGNKTIVSCAADGQVRVTRLKDDGTATGKRLAKHRAAAHKLSLVPDEPQMFLSSGEDGQVLLFDLRVSEAARRTSETGTASTSQSDVRATQGPVAKMLVSEPGRYMGLDIHAVHHHPMRPWLFGVAASDCVARVYDARMALRTGAQDATDLGVNCPPPVAQLRPLHMHPRPARPGQPSFQITCVVFNKEGQLLASYNDEDIYLFSAEGASGQQRAPAQAKLVSPSVPDAAEARSDRKRKASGEAADGTADEVLSNPEQADEPHALAPHYSPKRQETEAGTSKGVDSLMGTASGGGAPDGTGAGAGGRGGGGGSSRTAVGESSGAAGSSGRRGAAASLHVYQGEQQAENYVLQIYRGHRNSQTIKGVNFYGASEEYVITGSDCGHIFIWQRDDDTQLLRWLKGDQWVVNCLEPHPWQPLVLATSGIEETVKIWSPIASDLSHMEDLEKAGKKAAANIAQRVHEEQRVHRLEQLAFRAQARAQTRAASRRAQERAAGRNAGGEGNEEEDAVEEERELTRLRLLRESDPIAAMVLRILFSGEGAAQRRAAASSDEGADEHDDDHAHEGHTDDGEDEEEDEGVVFLPRWAVMDNEDDDEDDNDTTDEAGDQGR